jgi:hypothetical protein
MKAATQMMNEATSDRWFDALIESLQDPDEAIACLEVLLEETEDDPVVRDRAFVRAMAAVTEGQIAAGRCSEAARDALQRFEQGLTQPGTGIIYAWVDWLRAIGFGLVIQQGQV